jgi:hypothetical protein
MTLQQASYHGVSEVRNTDYSLKPNEDLNSVGT